MKPKEWHERHLANADKEKIAQHLNDGQDQDITRTAATLAHQCHLFVHFKRLWIMRVADLDENLRTERFMRRIYMNKRALYKELVTAARS